MELNIRVVNNDVDIYTLVHGDTTRVVSFNPNKVTLNGELSPTAIGNIIMILSAATEIVSKAYKDKLAVK